MRTLRNLDTKILPKIFGLQNIGNICWFNSLLQSLLSCTSLVSAIINSDSENPSCMFRALEDFVDSTYHAPEKINEMHQKLFQAFNSELQKRGLYFGNTQQDCEEAFGLLIELLDNKRIENIFTHKKIIKIMDMRDTEKLFLEKESHENRFYINIAKYLNLQKNNTSENILPYMLRLQKDLLQDYKPEKNIEDSSGKYITATYTATLPEVLVVVLQKYTRKVPVLTPEILRFQLENSNKSICYKIVSIIHHSGNMYSGHYTASCLRENEEVYYTSDMQTRQQSGFDTSQDNNYIIFYHYCGIM